MSCAYHPPGTAHGYTNRLRDRPRLHQEARPRQPPSYADTMPVKRTPLGAVCSEIERPRMSLNKGPNASSLESVSNGPDAKAHEYHLIMHVLSHFPNAPVASLLFRQSRCIARILLTTVTRDLAHGLGLFWQGFILSRAGCHPRSLTSRISSCPCFILTRVLISSPDTETSAFFPTARHTSPSDNDVVNVRLFLSETKSDVGRQ